MLEVLRAHADGPIRRGMTLLTSNEIAGLVVFWALFLIRLEVRGQQLSFLSKPASVQYVRCGEDVLLNWTYTSPVQATKISWYTLKEDGTTIADRFARKDAGRQLFYLFCGTSLNIGQKIGSFFAR